MEDVFITGINVTKYRNIENLNIELPANSRTHLIITGKNGSGKSSLITLIADSFNNILEDNKDIDFSENWIHRITRGDNLIYLYFNADSSKENKIGSVKFSDITNIGKILFINIPAEHLFNTVKAPDITNIKKRYNDINLSKPHVTAYHNIIQTMVTMRIQQLEAKENKDEKLYNQSVKWFNTLNNVISIIYDTKDIELKYIPLEYNYKIIHNGIGFDFNQMADGFSSFFRIVSELMEKMDYYTDYGCDYTLPGIAFIDELETHMHVSMQKMALPFLTEMFPNIQFIVTTHSPFIINSIENATVYDLSIRESLENPSQYSYESIIEGYFDIDMYSKIMKDKLARYRELAFNARSDEEKLEFSKLRVELQAISPAQKETYIAFNEIERKRKSMI